MSHLYGLYRATVVDDVDPSNLRRLRIQIPEIHGTAAVWAEPCVPARSGAQPGRGWVVWVLFEAGDPERPVWIGTRP